MLTINPDPPHKPCDYFDVIGETSTPLQFTYSQIIGTLQNLDIYFADLFAIYQGIESVERYAQDDRITSSPQLVIFSDS